MSWQRPSGCAFVDAVQSLLADRRGENRKHGALRDDACAAGFQCCGTPDLIGHFGVLFEVAIIGQIVNLS